MALIMRASASSGAVHVGPPGLYDAVITDVKQDHITGGQFGGGDVVRIYARLLDVLQEDGEAVIIDAIANFLLTPMSKLWGWLENLGLHPEIGYDIDIEQAIGKTCVLSIIDNVKDGATFSKVDGIYPQRNRPSSPPELLTPTGGINWTAFWAECGRRHITREMVTDYLGGDINSISIMPIDDVLRIIEELRGV